MGGGAFAQAAAQGEPTLNTPRMSPQEYTSLKTIYLNKLQGYFEDGRVACLIEAPEKASYGDMDIFVALDRRVDFIDMAKYLGATGIICHSGGQVQKCTLAVAKDNASNKRAPVVYKHVQENNDRKARASTTVTEEEYAQIDVEIVPSALLDWHTFYSSYGDLAGLLGHIVHNLGFTVTDRGLRLRMKELDFSKTVKYVNIADREGLVFLSSDPRHVMEFLGLSVESFDAGFNTLDELYEWLGTCRLLSAETIKYKRNNAHERRREHNRPIFTRFFDEWIPAHLDVDADPDKEEHSSRIQHLRQTYLEEAIEYFSKREEYNMKHSALVLKFTNAAAADLLRPLIARHSDKEDKQLNEIVRAFRRHVAFRPNGQPYVLDAPHSDAESQLHFFLTPDGLSLKDPQAADEWVAAHWEELRALERQRTKAINSESA